MSGQRVVCIALTLGALALPAHAGIIFNRQPKVNPAERVPQLLSTAKTDTDEHKRIAAVGELRQYDPAVFPDLVPTLLHVLANDPKAGVRAEAAETLSKLRPVTAQVGRALEQAQSQDASMRVRLQARYSLLGYHWAGYHGPKKSDGPSLAQTLEPPPAPNPPAAGPRLVAQPAAAPSGSAPSRLIPFLRPASAEKSKETPPAVAKMPPAEKIAAPRGSPYAPRQLPIGPVKAETPPVAVQEKPVRKPDLEVTPSALPPLLEQGPSLGPPP